MEMCLTSTNFTFKNKKKKFTAVHFVKGLLVSVVGFFLFVFLFVSLFACVIYR